MKDIRFNISLYIIIPFIFAGISLLSIILSYNITLLYIKKGIDPEWTVIIFAIVMIILSFICGLLIAKKLLSPVEQFLLKTEQFGIFKKTSSDKKKSAAKDDMHRFTLLFDQVTEILSRVESQKLFPQIIGQSKAMRGVFNQIIKVAATDSTVLILGETGTGKELITKSIHEHSRRKEKPFVTINCAAIPEGLLESELFGHEKGAFTSADVRKLGKFEVANGGTIFMDEIGDMPLQTQAKVLRVIQESQIERVGGVRQIKVDVRFIAATNKNLSNMVEAEKFRQDLFFRLNVFTIHVPPLRQRKEDIHVLVDEFLKQLEKKLTVSSETLQILQSYSWPGNVRELQNVVEASCVLANDVIEPRHIPPFVTRKAGNSGGGGDNSELTKNQNPETQNMDHRLTELEKGMIVEALKRAGGVQVAAARLLGIKEKNLRYRVKKFEIDVHSFKPDLFK